MPTEHSEINKKTDRVRAWLGLVLSDTAVERPWQQRAAEAMRPCQPCQLK